MRVAHATDHPRTFARPRQQSRFGGASASQTYAAKVRWLVGGMVSMIALLSTALILLAGANSPEQTPVQTSKSPLTQSGSAYSILIARQRIEAGEQLRPELFESQDAAGGIVPEGAILSSEKGLLTGMYATALINTGFPISKSVVSSVPSSTLIEIPPGYRAISIAIDEVISVAYFARPNTRVDVLLSYNVKNEAAVVTVVETAKVVSVGADTNPNSNHTGAKTATLLVTAEDARKVELAKRLGTLSLVLAGEQEIPSTHTDRVPTTAAELFKTKAEPSVVVDPVDGRMAVTDAKTGRQVMWVLVKGKWKVEQP